MNLSPPPDAASLRSFWELAHELFAIVDDDGRFRIINAAWTRDLGWDLRALDGRPWSDLVHPEDRRALTDAQAALDHDADGTAAGDAATTDLEVRLRGSDDRYRDVTLRLQRNPSGGLFLLGRDVTDERHAQRDLQESERRFRLAMDHAPIGMTLIDLEGSWFLVNDALCRLLGRGKQELVGRVVDEVTHPDDLARSHAVMTPLLAGERDHFTFDKRYIHAAGHPVDVSVTASMVRAEDGEPLCVVGQIVDISERNRTEARLRAAVEELQRANDALENFATVASHDLKTPMSVVHGVLNTLVSRPAGALGDREADLLHRALRHIATLSGVIDGLLEMSRMRGRPLEVVPVDLGATLDEVHDLLRHDIEREAATITAGELPTVHGDPHLLRLLLQNLVTNAIKFRHPDRAPVVIIGAERRADSWELSVEDNGRGFDAEDQEAIFELFGRTGSGERIEGAGIGLATCRQIVQQHGGSIRATAMDGGARFLVTLPADDATHDG